MKPLYTQLEYNNVKSSTELPLKCYDCGNTFYKMKKYITHEIKTNKGEIKFCSQKCNKSSKKRRITLKCDNCKSNFEKLISEQNKTNFCSNSCQASYQNKHKKYGTRRSKLEKWLEQQLILLYPNLDIHFNRKDTIGSELDIYIPSLKLAFELNGIFHYEPIFGKNKLNQIQENDISKTKACIDSQIDLCIIDTSTQKYVKPKTSQKYLDIINNIIKERVLTS